MLNASAGQKMLKNRTLRNLSVHIQPVTSTKEVKAGNETILQIRAMKRDLLLELNTKALLVITLQQ